MSVSSTGSNAGVADPSLPPALHPAHSIRTDIQALRGLAILLVLAHHAKLPGVPGGFLGVDIFFVISGFLITGLIHDALIERRFLLRDFYRRRIRRLFPAAYATLTTTALAAPFLLESFEHRQFVAQLMGAFTFTSNFVLWRQSDYFGTYSAMKPLLHMWSLSIEEQFYLFLPVAMLLLRVRARLPLAMALALVSLGLCLTLRGEAPSAIFYLLPFRAWELGIGSVFALLGRRGIVTPGRYVWLRIVCLCVLLAVPLTFGELRHPRFPALAVCLATAGLLIPGMASDRIARALWPLTLVGDRSYSLYLVHWPVFAFANNVFLGAVSPATSLALLLASFVLAELQYRVVESRFRTFALSRTVIAILLLIPVLTIGASWAWTTVIVRGAVDRTHSEGLARICANPRVFEDDPACRGGPAPRTMIWGDSFAMHLVPGVVASTSGDIVQATRQMCGPLLGLAPVNRVQNSIAWGEGCDAFNQSVIHYLVRTPSIETVVLSSAFTQYLPGAEKAPWQALVRKGAEYRLVPASEARVAASLARTVAAVRTLGKRVILIAPPPSIGFDIAQCLDRQRLGLLTLSSNADCQIDAATYRQVRVPVLQFLDLVQRRRILPVLRLEPFLCAGGVCRTVIGRTALYRDHAHLSIAGSHMLGMLMRWGEWIDRHAR